MILRASILTSGLLLAFAAHAASPTIDGAAGGTDAANLPGSHTSVSATLTTASAPDIIVCAIAISGIEGSPNTITNCSASGLTFSLRKRYPNDMGSNCGILDVNPCNENVEVWESVAAAPLTAVSITATYATPLCPAGANNGCRASLVVFGVTDLASIAAPHDPSISLPNTNFSAGPAAGTSGTYTTANPDDLLIWYFGGAALGTAGCISAFPVSPFFTAVGVAVIGTNCMAVASLSVNSRVNTTYSTSNNQAAFGIVGDAFTGNGLPPPTPNPPRRPFAHGWPW